MEFSYLKVVNSLASESFTIYAPANASKNYLDEDIQRVLIMFKGKLGNYGVSSRESDGKVILFAGTRSSFVELTLPQDRVNLKIIKDYLNGCAILKRGELPSLR